MPSPSQRPPTGPEGPGEAGTEEPDTLDPVLFDERSRPGFRGHFVRHALGAHSLDIAIERMRLDGVDLGRREMGHLSRIRVVLANAEAEVLLWDARRLMSRPDRVHGLRFMISKLERGVLSLRACPLAGWSPDFSVFHRTDEAPVALLGHHWFQRPYPFRGPAFGSIHSGQGGRSAARRFEELWDASYDVGASIRELLSPLGAPGSPPPEEVHSTS